MLFHSLYRCVPVRQTSNTVPSNRRVYNPPFAILPS